MAFYLDHPAAFGRFYVVARLYSALWGAVGAGVVFTLVRRLSRSELAGVCGALAFALLPAVVTAAHEAKPHLAGATLALWAVLKADDFVRTGRRRDAVWAGVLCGAAASMVVSMVVGFALLPAMGWLRGRHGDGPAAAAAASGALRNVVVSLLCGASVYALTNPFVIYHALFDRGVFASNLGNSTAMYGGGNLFTGVVHGLRLLGLAMGDATATLAATVLAFWAATFRFVARNPPVRRRAGRHGWGRIADLAILLLTVAGANAAFYFPLAAGKPAEYARFGLPVAAVAAVFAVAFFGRPLAIFFHARPTARRRWRRLMSTGALAPALLASLGGLPYVYNFVADHDWESTRTRAAVTLESLRGDGRRLVMKAEPAPYDAAPFDLWRWRAELVPALEMQDADWGGQRPPVFISTADLWGERGRWIAGPLSAVPQFVTPISWANKPMLQRLVP